MCCHRLCESIYDDSIILMNTLLNIFFIIIVHHIFCIGELMTVYDKLQVAERS